MSARVPRVRMAIELRFQPYGKCVTEECGWNTEPYADAKNAVKRHVAMTGHTAQAIQETVSEYVPLDGAS